MFKIDYSKPRNSGDFDFSNGQYAFNAIRHPTPGAYRYWVTQYRLQRGEGFPKTNFRFHPPGTKEVQGFYSNPKGFRRKTFRPGQTVYLVVYDTKIKRICIAKTKLHEVFFMGVSNRHKRYMLFSTENFCKPQYWIGDGHSQTSGLDNMAIYGSYNEARAHLFFNDVMENKLIRLHSD